MNLNSSLTKVALLATLATGIATPALAEGPMATDDAGTLDQGGMKIEAVLSRDDKARGSELVFGFGPIETVEVGLAFARATDRADNPSTKLRGTSIGIKWVPIQNKGDEGGWSLGASFGYGSTRVNERATPDKFTEKEFSLTGLASYRLENGQVLHMNLGAVRVKAQGERDTVGTWGVGYEFPLAESLQLTVEAFGEEHAGPDKAIGLRYEVFDGFKISAAVGRGNDRSFGQVGLAWEF
jgi:hypothetical protein